MATFSTTAKHTRECNAVFMRGLAAFPKFIIPRIRSTVHGFCSHFPSVNLRWKYGVTGTVCNTCWLQVWALCTCYSVCVSEFMSEYEHSWCSLVKGILLCGYAVSCGRHLAAPQCLGASKKICVMDLPAALVSRFFLLLIIFTDVIMDLLPQKSHTSEERSYHMFGDKVDLRFITFDEYFDKMLRENFS